MVPAAAGGAHQRWGVSYLSPVGMLLMSTMRPRQRCEVAPKIDIQ